MWSPSGTAGKARRREPDRRPRGRRRAEAPPAGSCLVLPLPGLAWDAPTPFAALCFGMSVGFPLAISAAAARGDRPAATNVASLALFAYSSSLIGPLMVGFVADSAGLRMGLATVLPLIILSTLLAGELKRRVAPASPGLAPENTT